MCVTIASGATAGIMSWILVIPFDVMKTIMQAQSNPDKHRNMRSLVTTRKNVSYDFHIIYHWLRELFWMESDDIRLQKYGWRVFFRGSWMLIVRSIPVNAATFLGMQCNLKIE